MPFRLTPVRVGVRRVDARGVDRHRAVEVDRGTGAAALGHQLVHQADHLLRPSHREGGDEQHAAAGEGARRARPRAGPHRDRGVRAVAVGALDHQVVGVGRELGVAGPARSSKRPTSPLKSTRVRCPSSLHASASTEAAPSRWPASRKRKENAGADRAALGRAARSRTASGLPRRPRRRRAAAPAGAASGPCGSGSRRPLPAGAPRPSAGPRPARAWAACSRSRPRKPCLTSRGTRPMWSMWVWVSTSASTDGGSNGGLGPVALAQRLARPGTSRSRRAAARPPASTRYCEPGHRPGRAQEA